jgi:hypothetical protein
MRSLSVEPRLLKYCQLDQVSRTQKGWTARREKMKRREPQRGRKGRILSQEITLWSW